jgi:hypothetical protein
MTHITIERSKAQRIADAFEDLKKNHGMVYVEELVDIKQALAAPVQQLRSDVEPVAWSVSWHGVHCGNFFFRESDAIEHHKRLSLKFPNEKREVVALYTTPANVATPLAAQRQWFELTDEEIGMCLDVGDGSMSKIIYAIEAKLKEKNCD